jgi:hypothetical protein
LYGTAEAAKRSGDRRTAHIYFQKLLQVAQRADQGARPELVEAHRDTE